MVWLLVTISLPHLRRHSLRTALTLVGIAVGVAAIVATTSVSDSVFQSFEDGIQETAGRAQLQMTNGSIGVPEDLIEQVQHVSGVASAAPFLEGYVFLPDKEGATLAIFGVDLLADQIHEVQLPRSAVHIPDELRFVDQADSIALSRVFASADNHALDTSLVVLTPNGSRTLRVRGLVDPVGPANLFGGVVGFMDIAGVQRLLGKEGKVDRIDITLAPDASMARVVDSLTALAATRAIVEQTSAHGAKARDLLFSIRVALTLAGLIAALVGFFIIHQTVRISVVQRRREIAILEALGVERRTLLSWFALEALVLGATAALVGFGLGLAVGKVSLNTFGTVAEMWVRAPTAKLSFSFTTFCLALAVGVGMTLVATLSTAWAVGRTPGARHLHLVPQASMSRSHLWLTVLGAIAMLSLTALLIAIAPPTLPYFSLVAYIAGLQVLILLGFTLLSPAVALALGRTAAALAQRACGQISLLVSSRWMVRTPAASVAVAAAMIAGLGATLADASLIASFKHSWLAWVDQYYQSDLLVSGGGATVSFLTSPAFSDDLVDELRAIPGVGEAQGVRLVEGRFRERPIVIQAWDRVAAGAPLEANTWAPIADRFWSGAGILVSDNLARKTRLSRGDIAELDTPSGKQRIPILGVFPDFQGSDLGSFAVSRSLYRQVWRDELVNRVRVWVTPSAQVSNVRDAIQATLGPSRGLRTVTAAEFRAAIADVVDRAFALSYALVVIALTVSFIGVVNLLLAAVLDRRATLRTLESVGVSPGQIALAVVWEGGLVGTVGTVVGLGAGFLASWVIMTYSVPMVNGWQFTYQFPATTALALSIGTILLAAVAGMIPAQVALRKSTVSDGRYE